LAVAPSKWSDVGPVHDENYIVLAPHKGFTDEELNFIINYDIKYRMGRDTEADDE
jgi:hypothetical protein